MIIFSFFLACVFLHDSLGSILFRDNQQNYPPSQNRSFEAFPRLTSSPTHWGLPLSLKGSAERFSPPDKRLMIEKEDRKILRSFLKTLVAQDDLGYVLLGEKPAVLYGYIDHLSWRNPITYIGSLEPYKSWGNQYKKKGWETWRKYSSQLSDRFVFLEEISTRSPTNITMFIIHKDRFCQVISEHQAYFEKVLKRAVTGAQLLEEAKEKPLFSVLLKENKALLGIILGFGKNNSRLFSKRKMKQLEIFPKKEDCIPSVALPVFRANWKDPETVLLREKYLACREKVQNIFLGRDGFDQIIQILFEN